MHSQARVGLAALLVSLLAGATALAATTRSGDHPRGFGAPAQGVDTTARAEMPSGYPAIGDLASFRRGRDVADDVPVRLAASPLLSDGVGDLTRARRAQVTSTRSAWIMPGRKDSICIVSDAALNCAPADAVAREGVAPSIFKTSDGPVTVMGIAADGVQRVELDVDGGETRVVDIVDNAFLFESRVQPRRLRWLYEAESRSFEFSSALTALAGG